MKVRGTIRSSATTSLALRGSTLLAAVLIALAAVPGRSDAPERGARRPAGIAKPVAATRPANLPSGFEVNAGQAGPDVRFLSRGNGRALLLTPEEALLVLSRRKAPRASEPFAPAPASVLRLRFAGSNPAPEITGVDPLPSRTSYFLGSERSRWRTGVPSYARVRYREVYPGVDVVYYVNERELEFDLVVAPGADPGQTVLQLDGPHAVELQHDGSLRLALPGGDVILRAPALHQQINGRRATVAGEYVLRGENRVGFRVGPYDVSQPLVIDPVLSVVSYLGGSAADQASGVTTDAAGNIYVLGETASLDLPAAGLPSGGNDLFLAKFSPGGGALLATAYLGGSDGETAGGIALDSAGNLLLTGGTRSSDFPLQTPVQANCHEDASRQCSGDAFLVRLAPDFASNANALLFSTYFGGSGAEAGRAVATDATGNAFITGRTDSTDFPLQSALQPYAGGSDAFVAAIQLDTGTLLYSTYLGGSGDDEAAALTTDNQGRLWIVGQTWSADFPVPSAATPGPQPQCSLDATGACSGDAFLVQLSGAGASPAMLYATFLGGSGMDSAYGVALDPAENVLVAGVTDSPDFPLANPLQPTHAGATDAFLANFSADGSTLVYSTFLGGAGDDRASAVASDALGNAFLAGSTTSGDFPMVDATQPLCSADSATGQCTGDAFLAAVNPAGSQLLFSTYLGGSGSDEARALAVSSTGIAYLAGSSASADLPVSQAVQPASGGDVDAFIAIYTDIVPLPNQAAPSDDPSALTACAGTINWNGSVDTQWGTAGNWTPAGPPGATDNVCIPPAFTGTTITVGGLAVANQSINSLISNAHIAFTGGPLTIAGAATFDGNLTQSGGSLTLNGASTVTGNFTLSGGTLGGTGVLTLPNLFTWSGGTQDGGGITDANGGMTLSGTTKSLRSRTLNTPAAVTWTAGRIDHGQSGVINNSGTWDLQSDDDFLFNLGGARGVFNNTGTFTKSAGTVATVVDMAFNHTAGTVNANSGTLTFSAQSASSAGFSVSSILDFSAGTHDWNTGTSFIGAGTVDVGGTVNVNGTVAVGAPLRLTSGGNLTGAGTLNLNALFTWSGGTQDGGGITNVNANMTIDTTTHSLRNRALNTSTVVTWTAGRIDHGQGGVINNSGTWNLQNDDDFLFNLGGTRGVFNNTGALTKSGGVGTSIVDVVLNHTAGTVNANSGTLQLSVQSASAAAVNVSAILDFSGGTHDWNGGTSFTGAGTIDIGATVTVNATVPVGAPLHLTSGTLTGTGTLNTNALFTWSGGSLDGGGITNVNGGMTLDTTTRTLRNRTLNTASAVTWTAGRFDHGQAGVINNTGTWTLLSDEDFLFNAGGVRGTFNNSGTLTKAGGTLASSVDMDFIHQSGATVNANSGTLEFDFASTSAGAFNVAATLRFVTGTHDLNSGAAVSGPGTLVSNATVNFNAGSSLTSAVSLTAGTLTLATGSTVTLPTLSQTGGTMSGAGTVDITGLFTWAGGTHSGGGITNANGGLAITTTTHTLVNRTLNTPAPVTWTAGRFDHGQGAIINNTSTWDLQADDDFLLNAAAPRGTFNNMGTFTKSGGVSISVVDMVFNNTATGVVNANVATLQFSVQSASDGAYNVATLLNFNAGTHDWNAGTSINGAGTVDVGTTVNVNSTVAVAATLHLTGGTLTGAGTMELNGPFVWSSGALDGGGITNVNGGMTLDTTTHTMRSRTLNTLTPVNWVTGRFDHGQSGVINNSSTWTIQADNGFLFNTGGVRGAFNNAGTLSKAGGAGTSGVDMVFNNTATGVVSVTSGILDFDFSSSSVGTYSVTATLRFSVGPHDLNAGTTITGAGTTRLSGTVNFNAGSAIATAVLLDAGTTTFASGGAFSLTSLTQTSGTMTGPDTVNISGAFTWSGGTQTGAGTTSANGTFSLTGGVNLTSNRVVSNAGAGVVSGGGFMNIGTGGVFSNLMGATLDLQNDSRIGGGVGGVNTFINQGTVNRTPGAGFFDISATFNNSGTVNVLTGTLRMNAGGTMTGPFNVAMGATLDFSAGTFDLNAGASITGAGTTVLSAVQNFNAGSSISSPVLLNGGTTTLATGSPVTLPTLTQTAGTLAGSDTLNITGAFTWSGGSQLGAATTNANGSLSLTAGVNLNTGRVLNNVVSMVVSGGGFMNIGNGAVFNNLMGATLDLQNNSRIGGGIGGVETFNNLGTINRSPATGIFDISATFNNSGTVNVLTGTLRMNLGGTMTGPFNVAMGATLDFSAGTFNLNAGANMSGAGTAMLSATQNFNAGSSLTSTALLTSGTTTFATGSAVTLPTLTQSGGTLAGTDTVSITGAFNWSGGSQVDAATTNANGSFTLTAGVNLNTGRVLNNVVSMVVSGGGFMNIGNGAVLNNLAGATMDLQNNGRLGGGIGGAETLNNQGTITRSISTGIFNISATFNNSGTVNVLTGTFQMSRGGTMTGPFSVAAGATLDFSTGVFDLNAGASVTGAGTSILSATQNFNAGSSITTPVLLNAGTTTFATGAAVTLPTLTQTSGTLTGAETVNVTGLFAWSGGSQTGTGTTNANGGWNLTGGVNLFNGRTLNNAAAGVVSGNGFMNMGNVSVLNNLMGATLDLQNDIRLGGGIGGANDINNMGTITRSTSAGTFQIHATFHNTGTVNVTTGTLDFLVGGNCGSVCTGPYNVSMGTTLRFSGGTFELGAATVISGAGTMDFSGAIVNHAGTFNITGATLTTGGTANLTGTVNSLGPLTITSGTLNLSKSAPPGPVVVPTLTQTGGTLTGVDTVNITGLFAWSGGSQTGTGTTNANGGWNLTGGVSLFNSRILNNAAAGVVSGNGFMNIGTGAVLNNLVGATLDVQNDIRLGGGIGGANDINNMGTITRSTSPGTFQIHATFHNTGTVNVTTGTLDFLAGGNCGSVCTGPYNVSMGTTLRFSGGTFELGAATVISGAGTMDFSGATVNHAGTFNITGATLAMGGTANLTGTVNSLGPLTITNGTLNLSKAAPPGPVVVPTLTQTGGVLTGADTVDITGLFAWSGGSQTGTATTNANGGWNLTGGVNLFNGRTLNNAAAGVVSSNGFMNIGTGAVLNNLTSATLELQNDIRLGGGIGGANDINNMGTITRSTSAGTFQIHATFHNTGTVNVTTGTLDFLVGGNCGSVCTGPYNVSMGTTLRFSGGTFDLGAATVISGAGTMDFSGATVNHAGTFNITGATLATGGTANLTGTVNSLGSLTITNGTLNLSKAAPPGPVVVPTLTQSGGILTGADTVNITGLFAWSGGSQTGTGITNANGGFNLTGGVSLFNSRILNNAAAGVVSSFGFMNIGNGAVLNNLAGATLDVQNNIRIGGGIGGVETFNNMGTLVRTTSAGTFQIFSTFSNTGTVEASSGTLDFASTFTQTAGVTRVTTGILSGGTLNINGGLLEGNTPGSITANINNAGGTLGPGLTPGTLNLTGTYTQGAGGSFTAEIGGLTAGTQFDRFNATGAATLGGALNATLTGGFTPSSGDSFVVMTFASRTGTFAFTNLPVLGGGLQWNVVYGATNVLLQVQAPAACTINFDNSNANNLWEDALNWDTNALPGMTDKACIGMGFNVTLSSGAHTVDHFSSDSPLTLSGGSLTLLGTQGIATANSSFTQSGGTLGGTGNLSIAGLFTFSGGVQNGPGATTANGGMNVTGSGQILNSRVLNNVAAATLSGLGEIQMGSNAVLNNLPGATFSLQNNNLVGQPILGGQVTINNGGTWSKSAGGGISSLVATFNNTGTVNAVNGTLRLNGSGMAAGSSTGAFNVGGTLQYVGGTHNLGAGATVTSTGTFHVDAATVAFNAGSSLATNLLMTNGTLTLDAGSTANVPTIDLSNGTINTATALNIGSLFIWQSGTVVATGGSVNVLGAATLNLTTFNGKTLDGGPLNNSGAVNVAGGILTLSNGADINNLGGGTFTVSTAPGLAPGAASDFTNAGTFNVSAIGSVIIPTFLNTGTAQVTQGVLESAAYTQTAGLTRLSGGDFDTVGGTFQLQGGVLDAAQARSLIGDLVNTGGIVRPGMSPGTFNISGDYTQSGGGILEAELAGTAGGLFDVLNISGTATLGGTLNVLSFGGFTPMVGNMFQIMSYSSVVGDFAVANDLTGIGLTMNRTAAGTSYTVSFNFAGPCDINFDNSSGNGLWQDAMNWDTNVLPAPTDDVCIGVNIPGPFAVTKSATGGDSINSLTVADGQGPFTLADFLTIAADSAIGTGGMVHSFGTLSMTGQLDINGPLVWTDGFHEGTGVTNLASTLNITSSINLRGRTLNLNGGAVWSNGFIRHGFGATINVPVGQTFGMQGDLLTLFNLGGAPAAFNIMGTFIKSAGAGNGILDMAVNNSGSVNVNSGALIISANTAMTHTGVFNLAGVGGLTLGGGPITMGNGASVAGPFALFLNTTQPVNFNSGSSLATQMSVFNTPVTFNPGSSITGNLNLSGGSVALNTGSPVAISTVTQSGGTLGGNDTLTITQYNWTGGLHTGNGTTTIQSTLALFNNVDLSARTINLVNGLTWSSGTINHGGGGVINVPPGATFAIQGDLSTSFSLGGAAATINNAGAFMKSAGPGSSNIDMQFTNSAAVNSLAGTLNFTNSFAQSGGTTSLTGGSLGGGITFNFNGGFLEAAGGATVTGTLNNAAAVVRPGAQGLGTLNIVGNYTQGAAGHLEVELNGTGAGQFDVLAITGQAGLNGTLDVLSFGGFTPVAGNAFQVMTYGSRTSDFSLANDLTGSGLAMNRNAGATSYTVSFAPAAPPCNVNFDNSSGTGLWQDPNNWVSNTLPVPGDNVCIGVNPAGPFTVTKSAAGGDVINSLNVANGQGVFTLSDNLTITTNSTIGDGGIVHNAGTLTGPTLLTINGPADWSGGTQQGAGTTTFNGFLSFSVGTVLGRTLNLNGGGLWSGILNHGQGTVINIPLTATLDIQNDAGGFAFNQGGGQATLNNAGSFFKSGGTGTSNLAIDINNSGIITALSGTMSFRGAYMQSGGSSSLVLGGGRVTSVSPLNLSSGVIQGNDPGVPAIVGDVNQAGGFIVVDAGTTTLTIDGNYTQGASGTLFTEINGASAGLFDVLNVTGTATLGGILSLISGTGFVPAVGNSFVVMNYGSVAGDFAVVNDLTGSGLTVNRTVGATTYMVSFAAPAGACDINFDNTSGTGLWQDAMNWDTDVLPSPTDDACIGVSPGGPFTVTKSAAGGDSVNSLTVANGQGVFSLSDNLSIAALSTIGNGGFTQTAGVFTGAGGLNLNGLFTWSGGVQDGAGSTSALGGMLINTAALKVQGTRLITNSGNAVMTDLGQLQMSGTFLNNGVFDFQDNADLLLGPAGAPQFTNMGTLTKSGGAGNTSIQIPLFNSGTLTTNAGTLTVSGSSFVNTNLIDVQAGNLTATLLTQSSGTTRVSSGGVLTFTNPFVMNGGVLEGINGSTIVGSVTNNGGVVRPGMSPGALTISGNYTQGASGTLEIELGGTGGGQFDMFTVGGSSSLNGRLSLLPFGGFVPMAGNSFTVMNYGSLAGDFATVSDLTGSGLTLNRNAGATSYQVSFAAAAASADLSVTKSDSPDPVSAGTNLTYTIVVTNNGPDPATSVMLTDPLPANVAFVSATPTQGSCANLAGTVTCPLGALANGANATVTLVVTPSAAAAPQITNTASVTAAESDPVPGNNSAAATTTVLGLTADLAVTKADSPDPVNVGQPLTYTLTVTNNGPDPATSVVLTDTLATTVAFQAFTASQGMCSRVGVTVTCNLGLLVNGAMATVTIAVTPTATAVPSVNNSASVTAAESDPVPANNSALATTTVVPVADVAVTQFDSPDPVGTNATLTYTVTVANNGPSPATGVVLNDTLPGGVAFVSASPACAQAGGVVTCNLGTIASGAVSPVTIQVTSPAGVGMLSNTASTAANEFDPNLANNSVVENTSVVTGPIVTLSTSTLVFASQPAGVPSPPQAFTLNNAGNAPVTISSIIAAGDFAQTNNCGTSLAAGGTCFVTVTFTPSTTGPLAGSVTITHTAPNSPSVVMLSGTGVLAPAISLTSVSVVFGTQLINTTSPVQTVTLTNSGSAVLNIFGITASAEFAQTNNCGSTVAAGASCVISITFTPTGTGIRTGAITITSDAPGSPPVITLTGIGASPGVTLSTTLLTFASQPVGTTSGALTVTLSNTGSAALNITSITVTGDFAQTNTCGASVAAGANCVISLTFTPTVAGSRSGLLTITDSGVGSPRVVSLSGTGVAAALSVSPLNLTFTAQPTGTTSGAQVVTVTNTGGVAVTITSVVAAGDFAQTNNCPASLALAASCTVSVAFTPLSSGLLTGTVTVTHSAPSSPDVINLLGTGVASGPALALSATQLTFASSIVGNTSPGQPVTLTNTGNALLTFTSITTAGDFAQTSTCGATLVAMASCTVTVTFTPSAGGTLAGSLTISSDAPGSPHAVALSGTGVPVGPAITLSVNQLNFSGVAVGGTSAAQTITVSNTGNAALTIVSITASGDYAQTNNCGGSVAVNVSCTITVTFSPTASGLRAGSVTITHNAPGSPHAVSLTGSGTSFSLAVPVGTPTSATVAAGQSATFNLAAVAAGGFNEQVTVGCAGAPLGATCTVLPGSFALSGSVNVAVTITTSVRSSVPPLAPRNLPPPGTTLRLPQWLTLLLAGLAAIFMAQSRRRRRLAPAFAAFLIAVVLAGCAGGVGVPAPVNNAGTPPGSYTITVTATSASGMSRTTTLGLTVQ